MMCVDDTCNILVAEGAATAATLRLLIGNDLEIQAVTEPPPAPPQPARCRGIDHTCCRDRCLSRRA